MRWGELTSGKREAPAPLEGNIRATVIGITAVWAVAFLVQLPFYGRYADDGRTEWIWTCLAGVGLGFLGLWYVARRDAALRRAEPSADARAEEHADARAEDRGERREESGSDGTGDDDAGRG